MSDAVRVVSVIRTGMHRLLNNKGYSSVFLAMVFFAFAMCTAAAVVICRSMVITSECESYGRVWARAVLSEYDRHLLEDYGIMAYFGNETEVRKQIDSYAGYSLEGRLCIRSVRSDADLTGYELGYPENFRKAVQQGLAAAAVQEILSGKGRQIRSDEEDNNDDNESGHGGRIIGNKVVLDTLPSCGAASSVDTDSVLEHARSLGSDSGFKARILGAGTDVAFIWKYFGNNVTSADDKPSYFTNEWEYIIGGKPSDKANYDYCRVRLFLIRNGLDLVSLYRDSAKVEMITTVAEMITPGPLGLATQVLIAEAWAALETESDMKELYEGRRVPLIKTADEWQTGLGAVLDSESVRKKLNDESKELLDENRKEIGKIAGSHQAADIIRDGLNYDEHLMLLMLAVNENIRLLRVMDIVQINMKYRYYRDFNLMEYHTGVRFGIEANGRNHVFEDHYK